MRVRTPLGRFSRSWLAFEQDHMGALITERTVEAHGLNGANQIDDVILAVGHPDGETIGQHSAQALLSCGLASDCSRSTLDGNVDPVRLRCSRGRSYCLWRL